MSNFERRLHAMKRRDTDAEPMGGTAVRTAVVAADLGWQAAERVTNLADVAPGTSIKIIIEGRDDRSRLEVYWDEQGTPTVQQF